MTDIVIPVYIRPVSDCMKEPSLRGGAADAAIQKVFTETDAALLDFEGSPIKILVETFGVFMEPLVKLKLLID